MTAVAQADVSKSRDLIAMEAEIIPFVAVHPRFQWGPMAMMFLSRPSAAFQVAKVRGRDPHTHGHGKSADDWLIFVTAAGGRDRPKTA